MSAAPASSLLRLPFACGLAALACWACASSSSVSSVDTAAETTPDIAALDAAVLDTAVLDTAVLDVSPLDTAPLDTAPLDAGDVAAADAATQDTASDTAPPDSALVDTTLADASTADTSATDAGPDVADPPPGWPKCDDGDPCTVDYASKLPKECVHIPNTELCEDGNPCTSFQTCGGGICSGGAPTNCDDGKPCTIDSCVPSSGCHHTPKDCSDGDPCITTTCDVYSGDCKVLAAPTLCAAAGSCGLCAASVCLPVPTTSSVGEKVYGGSGVDAWGNKYLDTLGGIFPRPGGGWTTFGTDYANKKQRLVTLNAQGEPVGEQLVALNGEIVAGRAMPDGSSLLLTIFDSGNFYCWGNGFVSVAADGQITGTGELDVGYPSAVTEDGDGLRWAVATSNCNYARTIACTSDGNCSNTVNLPGLWVPTAMAALPTGGQVLVGWPMAGAPTPTSVIVLDTTGHVAKGWDLDIATLSAVVALPNGDFVVAGKSSSGNYHGFVARLSPTGAVLWTWVSPLNFSEFTTVSASGGVIVAFGPSPNLYADGLFAVSLDSTSGAKLWGFVDDSLWNTGNMNIAALVPRVGGWLAVGKVVRDPPALSGGWLLRLNSLGHIGCSCTDTWDDGNPCTSDSCFLGIPTALAKAKTTCTTTTGAGWCVAGQCQSACGDGLCDAGETALCPQDCSK